MALVGGVPRSVMPNTGIKGFDKVLSNLNKEIKRIEGASMKGLVLAAIAIRRDMDRTPPLIPVDTGNLRASWFTSPISIMATRKQALLIGFSANYSLFVHEMLDPSINWSRQNSGPKFFEYAIKRNKDLVIQIIQNNVKIKK